MSVLTPDIIGVMPDTSIGGRGVDRDTDVRFRLTKTAAERAKSRLGLRRYDDIAELMGISRRSFYRLLEGTFPISLNQAAAFSDQIDWPLTRAFERLPRG